MQEANIPSMAAQMPSCANEIIMDRSEINKRNTTFNRFGGVDTLITDYCWWSVQIRPQQATLGSLILLAHGTSEKLGNLHDDAHTELGKISRDIEVVLSRFGAEKINYLMLMMVDPHVHFHVIPRYPANVLFEEINFTDPGWPGLPELTFSASEPKAATRVCAALRDLWPVSTN